jgi:argininosuccinate lyase
MKVWQTEKNPPVDPEFFEFQRSLPFDLALLEEEIRVARAWVEVLKDHGTLTAREAQVLKKHLAALDRRRQKGEVPVSREIEDVHTLVEQYLTEKAGEAGKKLHTGRSRNDLAPATLRLYLLKRCREIQRALVALQEAILEQAERGVEVICPYYTHQQRAEPVRLSHYWLAHFFRLQRDRERLNQMIPRIALNPLGAGAGAGSFVHFSRARLEAALGFSGSLQNALDATSSRDFAAEFLAWASLVMVNLSALAQDLILWTSSEYGWAKLPDTLVTGSSLLPHKRNADGAELVRAKAGRALGNFVALMTALKGLPLGYAKDLQEDKERVLDTEKTVRECLAVMTKMVRALQFDADACARGVRHPFLGTVALVAALVKAGTPFRDAYREVADWARTQPSAGNEGSDEGEGNSRTARPEARRKEKRAERKPHPGSRNRDKGEGRAPADVDLSRFADRLPPGLLEALKDPLASVEARKVWCGVSRAATRRQMALARRLLGGHSR